MRKYRLFLVALLILVTGCSINNSTFHVKFIDGTVDSLVNVSYYRIEADTLKLYRWNITGSYDEVTRFDLDTLLSYKLELKD